MQETSFYQTHLDRVSRSFALCIQMLDAPFRGWISLSYLLCRGLDTIEDSSWESREIQDRQYAGFSVFLAQAPTREAVDAWVARFPKSIPEGELLLLQDSFLLFQDLHSLPQPVREVIQTTANKMHRGMQFYSRRANAGTLKLIDLTDTNRYCYFVAGVVGELLSGLYLAYQPQFRPSPEFHKNGLHFGLFLQKINLLKDQLSDEQEGRFLVPDRAILLGSLRENAAGALGYLLSLPRNEKGYRMFCACSLFLGAASLPWMQKAFETKDGSKIPRTMTRELIDGLEQVVQDDEAVRQGFEEYLATFPASPSFPPASTDLASADWFIRLSGLAPSEMNDLRLL